MPNRRRDAHAQRRHVPRHNGSSRPVVSRRPGRIRRRHRRLHAGVSIRIFTNGIYANMAAVGRVQRPKPRTMHAVIVASLRTRTRIPDLAARRARRYAFRYAPGKAISEQQHSRAGYFDASHGTQSPVRPGPLPSTRVTPALRYPTRTVRHVPVGAT